MPLEFEFGADHFGEELVLRFGKELVFRAEWAVDHQLPFLQAIAWPLASYAQQPKQPLKRVGLLASIGPCPLQPDNLIVRRLGELGWVEGQNLAFDCVSAIGCID